MPKKCNLRRENPGIEKHLCCVLVLSIPFIFDSPAGIMAAAGFRLAALSFNKNIVHIVTLLFLVHTGQSLVLQDDLQKRFIRSLHKVKEGVRVLKESQSGLDIILNFLEKANSAANQKQLKMFQENIQEAVDEAYRQKTEKAAACAVYTHQFNLMMLEHYPEMQKLKKSSYVDPLMNKLYKFKEQLFEILRNYLALQKEVYDGNTKDTEEKLKNTVKNLISRRIFHAPVGDTTFFLFLILCIIAMYWVCSHFLL